MLYKAKFTWLTVLRFKDRRVNIGLISPVETVQVTGNLTESRITYGPVCEGVFRLCSLRWTGSL